MDWSKLIFWGVIILVAYVVLRKLFAKDLGIGASEQAYASQDKDLLFGMDTNPDANRGAKDISDARDRIASNNEAMSKSASESKVAADSISYATAIAEERKQTKGGVL